MVRVPAANQQVGRSVQLQAPGVAPVQDQTGNQLRQLGRGLQIAGQGVQSLGDEIRDRDDNARTREADALFSDYVRQALNPNDGYRSQLGKAASEGYDAVRKGIEAKQRELAGTLRNDTQRQLFHRAAQARLGQAQGVIDGHAAQQTRAYEMAETATSIEGRKADYQASLGNPRAMATHLHLMRRDIAELAEMAGKGPKVVRQMQLEHETAAHTSVAAQLLEAGDFDGAGQYLLSNKDHMMAEPYAKLRGRVMQQRRAQDTADLASRIIARAPAGSTIAETRLHTLKVVGEMDMSVEDETRLMRHLDHQHGQAMEMHATQVNVAMEQARSELAGLPASTPTESLQAFSALKEMGLVAAFEKHRKGSQVTSRELSMLMFDLENGHEVLTEDGPRTLSTLTEQQADAIINQHGGATDADRMRFLRMVVKRNPNLGDAGVDEEKRVEDLRLSAVKMAARSALTEDERTALDSRRDGSSQARMEAAHLLSRYMNYFQERLPVNKGLADENAVGAYQEKLDELLSDLPYRRADTFFERFDQRLPEDFEPGDQRFFSVDHDGDPDTEPQLIGDDLSDPARIEAKRNRARLMQNEYWHRQVPRQRGESAESWQARINSSGLDPYAPSEQDIVEDLIRRPNA